MDLLRTMFEKVDHSRKTLHHYDDPNNTKLGNLHRCITTNQKEKQS